MGDSLKLSRRKTMKAAMDMDMALQRTLPNSMFVCYSICGVYNYIYCNIINLLSLKIIKGVDNMLLDKEEITTGIDF